MLPGAARACIKCRQPLTAENTKPYAVKNYVHKCDDCLRVEKAEQARQKRRRDPVPDRERSLAYNRRLQASNPMRYTARQMAGSAKKRSARMDLPFDLDTAYIESIAPEHCPVFGWELRYGGGEKTKDTASLDRIDSSRGYVRGNVQIISLLANLMKSDASPEELLAFSRWVREQQFPVPKVAAVKGVARNNMKG